MALPVTMGNDPLGPVAEWRRREDGATSFILVQIQAGSPRFALTGYAWRSHARPAGASVSGVARMK
jgi:hypothetical protein